VNNDPLLTEAYIEQTRVLADAENTITSLIIVELSGERLLQ
jgi:hypothetical protein